MRNLVNIVLLIVFCSGMSSCEMIKGWFDVDFETTFSGDLNIDILESARKSTSNYTFQSTAPINPLEDDQVAEYQDNIKEVVITRILAEVLELNRDSVVFMEGTTFSIVSGSNITEWSLGNDWTIVDTTEIRLLDLDGAYNQIEDMIEAQEEFNVGVSGICSEAGVSLSLRISIETQIAAEKLK